MTSLFQVDIPDETPKEEEEVERVHKRGMNVSVVRITDDDGIEREKLVLEEVKVTVGVMNGGIVNREKIMAKLDAEKAQAMQRKQSRETSDAMKNEIVEQEAPKDKILQENRELDMVTKKVVSLDELFKKTRFEPELYYRPLSDAEIRKNVSLH